MNQRSLINEDEKYRILNLHSSYKENFIGTSLKNQIILEIDTNERVNVSADKLDGYVNIWYITEDQNGKKIGNVYRYEAIAEYINPITKKTENQDIFITYIDLKTKKFGFKIYDPKNGGYGEQEETDLLDEVLDKIKINGKKSQSMYKISTMDYKEGPYNIEVTINLDYVDTKPVELI